MIIPLVLQLLSFGGLRIGPAAVEPLIRSADLVLRVVPTSNPSVANVREVIWSATHFHEKSIRLAADPPPKKGRVNERFNTVHDDSIVFLRQNITHEKPLVEMKGADHRILLHSNKCKCEEKILTFGGQRVLCVEGNVYFAGSIKHRHRNWISYLELKAAILDIIFIANSGSARHIQPKANIDL